MRAGLSPLWHYKYRPSPAQPRAEDRTYLPERAMSQSDSLHALLATTD